MAGQERKPLRKEIHILLLLTFSCFFFWMKGPTCSFWDLSFELCSWSSLENPWLNMQFFHLSSCSSCPCLQILGLQVTVIAINNYSPMY